MSTQLVAMLLRKPRNLQAPGLSLEKLVDRFDPTRVSGCKPVDLHQTDLRQNALAGEELSCYTDYKA